MTDFEVSRHIENINNNGFTVIKNNIDNDLIDRVICDFDEWSSIEENMFKKHNPVILGRWNIDYCVKKVDRKVYLSKEC
jgi:hypothetical protein